ncbi:hypothetical protein MO973_38750 [Paenibacillus sp. TRM 82003]|uniref:hypothetical protein n=1 Tax=Kineococcus sp. TRM81007 TaxID=2925831 RepID=UPI001F5ABFEA|nr:hypothetical protein [Kineococcus sp. TRM81007]MCI2239574.1 hypothetical protein [Kineococcus sp. TRM81007]MCI3926144.1 hypothetical protein [Paenibacillus sp. TRM 82003]
MDTTAGTAHHPLRRRGANSVRTWLLAAVVTVGAGMGAFGLGGGVRSLLAG